MVDISRFTGRRVVVAAEAYESPKKEQQGAAWVQHLRHLLKGVRSRKAPKTEQDTGSVSTPPPPTMIPVQPAVSTSVQELAITAVALGLATTGVLFFPPAQVASLPLLLYLGATPGRTVYTALRTKEGAPLAVMETVILALCLLRQAYLAGALSYGCYVVAKAWLQHQVAKTALPSATWQPPAWAWVQPDASAVPKAVSELHTGDRIIVQAGEMVPVTGIVSAGVAWVKCRDGAGRKVDVGSQIEAMTIVQAGCIWMHID